MWEQGEETNARTMKVEYGSKVGKGCGSNLGEGCGSKMEEECGSKAGECGGRWEQGEGGLRVEGGEGIRKTIVGNQVGKEECGRKLKEECGRKVEKKRANKVREDYGSTVGYRGSTVGCYADGAPLHPALPHGTSYAPVAV